MTLKVQDIFKAALSKIGAVAMDEPPSPSDFNKCLLNANLMLSSWSIDRLMLRGATTEAFPLISGKGAYTIGPSANFDTTKPVEILDAFIRDSAGEDSALGIVSQMEFDAYSDKSFMQARPERMFYDPGASQQSSPNTGTINLYPVPDAGPYTIYLISDKYLTSFGALTDDITLEQCYSEALVWNLALRTWPDFHVSKDVPKLIVAMAKATKGDLMRLNHKPVVAMLDIPSGKGGSYNFFSDSYGGR